MNKIKIAATAAGLFLSLSAGIPVAWGADGPPANLKPAKVAAAGLIVMDLEGERAWYEARLGMALLATAKAADGGPRDYLMGFVGEPDAAFVDLLKWSASHPRPNGTGRILLHVPNAAALADWLKTQGVATVETVANVNYSITDPEGNTIVLLTLGPQVAPASAAIPRTSAPCGSGPTRSRLLDAALRMMSDASPYEYEKAQEMYTQGLTQQGMFDEEYAKCLRANSAP